jgi:HEAT repeat protein
VATFDFLLSILKNSRGELKADAIYAFGNYDDCHVISVLKPFLKSKVPHYKINAAIALGKFEEFEDEALYTVYGYLHSGNNKLIELALYAIGELKLKKQKRICSSYLDSKNLNLRMQSSLALAKMGCKEAIPVLIDLLFNEDTEISGKLQKLLKNIEVQMSKNIDRIVKHIVSQEIEKLMEENKTENLEGLSHQHLKSLKLLYGLVEEYDEMEVIDSLINKI